MWRRRKAGYQRVWDQILEVEDFCDKGNFAPPGFLIDVGMMHGASPSLDVPMCLFPRVSGLSGFYSTVAAHIKKKKHDRHRNHSNAAHAFVLQQLIS